MRYIINEIKEEESISDGLILLVKAISQEDLMTMDNPRSKYFALPYSNDLYDHLSLLSKTSQGKKTFWEPNEDEFVVDSVIDMSGNEIMVYKSLDLILVLNDEEDDYYEEEEDDDDDDFEYKEDLFPLDDEDFVEDYYDDIKSKENLEEEDDDIFNDFYSNDSTDLSSYSHKRYSEKEIGKMSIKERHAECSKCSKAKNLGGLIDFYTYFYINGCQATNEYVIPGLSYLYGRAKDVDTLNALLQRYVFCLWELSQESKEVSQSLLEIGLMFPYLSNQQVDYLERLYNNPKYCEMMDDVLYDKEKLSRKITGITKEELYKTNDTFPPKLIKEIYNCFILNQRAQNKCNDEYTVYYVYVRRNNSIVKKEYIKVGSGECVINGTLDMKSFIEYIEPKYGKDCANFFLRKVLEHKPWYDNIEKLCRSYHEWVDWDILTDIAKDYFANEKSKIDEMKMDIALLYLERLNKRSDS